MSASAYVVAAGLLLVGAMTGVAAVAVHSLWWGLPLAAAAIAAALAGAGRGWLTRLPLALGFTVTVGFAVPRRSEGDYVVAGNLPGILLLLLALVVLGVALVTLPRRRRGDESGSASGHT